MNKYKVFIAREAETFLESTYGYLYSKNPTAADKWLTGIEQAINELSTLPHRGSVIPESAEKQDFANLHQVLFSMSPSGNTYRIIYSINEDVCHIVNVLTIRNSRQEPLK